MAGENITGTEGMGEARAAFESAIDAESPSRSKATRSAEKKPDRIAMEDLFPTREMDRREHEGGSPRARPPP